MTETHTQDVIAEEQRLREIHTNVEMRGDDLDRRRSELEQTIESAEAAIKSEAQEAAQVGREPDVDGHHRKAGEAQAELLRVKAEREGINTKALAEAIRRHRVQNLGVYADIAEEKTQAALAAIERAKAAYTEAHTAWVEANAVWGDLVRDHNRRAPSDMKLRHPPVYDWRAVAQTFEMPVPRCPSFEPVPEEAAA